MIKTTAIAAAITLTTVVGTIQPVYAEVGVGKLINQVQKAQDQASKSTQRETQSLENLKKKADNLIDTRVDSLNKLLQKLQADTKLSADDKSALSTEVQTTITNLNQLKVKIDADTDLATTRADAKTIITSYRIFAIFEPKIRLLVTIDNLSRIQTQTASLTPQLQDLINGLKSQGKDTSKLQSLLDDINTNLSTIGTKLATDKQTVLAVTVDSNPSTFATVRQDLASVRSTYAKIRSDIGQMRQQFQILITGNTQKSASPSAKQ